MGRYEHNPPWIRLFMAISAAAYAVLLMVTPSKLSFVMTGTLALILAAVFCFRTELLHHLFADKPGGVRIVSGILSLSAVYTAKSSFFTNCYGWMMKAMSLMGLPRAELLVRMIPWGMALLALPMVFGYFTWFVDFMYRFALDFWKKSDYTERFFLLTAGIIFSIMIVFAYVCTQAFYGAHINGFWYNFDLIYSADSGYLVHQDVFRNVGAEQNDLRQPLFGVFAMPFAEAAWLISRLFFFLPQSYITVLQIMEMFLFLVAAVLISRMLELQSLERTLFLVLFSLSYPVLIFSLTAEQYLMAVFYLVLLIYLRKERVGGSLGFVAATGSLLTTGVLFPLITWDKKFSRFVKNSFLLCGVFFSVTILSGRLTTFLDIPGYIAGYGYYAGGNVAAVSKLMQYFNFVASSLFAPASHADFETLGHMSWQMMPVNHWNVLGILIFVGAILGAILRWKSEFSQICLAWMGFSFLLLGIVGWGTIDNGLLLYSLYFGWAFVSMLFQLCDVLLGPFRWMKITIIVVVILIAALVNVLALREVLIFATQFYPALG